MLQHNMYHVILAIWTIQANRESHCFSSLSCSASRAWRRPDKSGKFSCSAGIGHLHVVDFRVFFFWFYACSWIFHAYVRSRSLYFKHVFPASVHHTLHPLSCASGLDCPSPISSSYLGWSFRLYLSCHIF